MCIRDSRWVTPDEARLERPNTRPVTARWLYEGLTAVKDGNTIRASEIQERLTKLGRSDPFAASAATVVKKTIQVGETAGKGDQGDLFVFFQR